MSSETSRFDVLAHNIDMPPEGIRIVPIGDIHENEPMFADDVFRAWCAREKERSKKIPTYYIGLGDYQGTMSASERKALVALHESSQEWLDEQITDDIDRLAKRLEWTKGRWLGILAGNHTYTTLDGQTTTQMLAERLDAHALGICAAIRLIIKSNACGPLHYDIWAYHGKGGGVTAGATLNSLERWSNGLDADLVLMGHDHKRAAIPLERLGIYGLNERIGVRQKEMWLVRTGSFLKGYEPGKVSYIASRALRPVSLGTATIALNVTRRRRTDTDGDHRDARVVAEVTV